MCQSMILFTDWALPSNYNACRIRPLMVLYSKECGIQCQCSFQTFSPKTLISHNRSHMVLLCKDYQEVGSLQLFRTLFHTAWQYWPRFWLCCKNLLYLWRLRTATDQSWFTITFKVPTTKPCWKVNPICQVPTGYLGIDHFSNESLNNGY